MNELLSVAVAVIVTLNAPFAKCIDLTDFDHSAIVNVYRTEGFTGDVSSTDEGMDR